MIERRLLIISGKGGVGKSAVAAAAALTADRSGARVLAIDMVGRGGGLARHLGSPPLGVEPTEIRPGLFASRLDRPKALTEYLRTQLGIPGMMSIGPVARAFDALASAAPAIREIIAMGKVLYEVRRGGWDLVVADAPPTGQITSFLRSPQVITDLVPAGRIREQAAWMKEILTDSEQSGLVVVTIPEELPVSETRETLATVQAEGLMSRTWVVANRVLPHLEASTAALPSGRAGNAALLHLTLASDQRHWLDSLDHDVELPFLFGVVTPTEVSARLADDLNGAAGP